MPRRRGVRHLLDHTARIWRRTEEVGGTYREKQVAYELVEDCVPIASDGESVVHGPAGPGVVPSGQRWFYADVTPGRVFPKRGLLELVTGPTAPAFLEIESADPFRGHHFEIRCSEFNGETPTAPGS